MSVGCVRGNQQRILSVQPAVRQAWMGSQEINVEKVQDKPWAQQGSRRGEEGMKEIRRRWGTQ